MKSLNEFLNEGFVKPTKESNELHNNIIKELKKNKDIEITEDIHTSSYSGGLPTLYSTFDFKIAGNPGYTVMFSHPIIGTNETGYLRFKFGGTDVRDGSYTIYDIDSKNLLKESIAKINEWVKKWKYN